MAKLNIFNDVEAEFIRTDLPQFGPGDQVKVQVRVAEKNAKGQVRERLQAFQGVVIRRRGGGVNETFTVRKVSFNVGVERTFPVHSPNIAAVEIVSLGKVRRAKLYYLRELTGRAARIKERRDLVAEGAAKEGRRKAKQKKSEAPAMAAASTVENGSTVSADDALVEAPDAATETPAAEVDAPETVAVD